MKLNNINLGKDMEKGRIGIFGLGRTGASVFKYLCNQPNYIICWDDNEKTRKSFASANEAVLAVPIQNEGWTKLEKIIISPGIKPSHEIFSLAKQHNIPISSDIEIFLQAVPDAKIISVTGTNGKSTTTALIEHILKYNDMDFCSGGNIGRPVLELPRNKEGYVLELSSFQIDLLQSFNPDISILLNIEPDHLDHHGSFENYCNAKFKAFKGGFTKIIGVKTAESSNLYKALKKEGDKKLIAINTKKPSSNIMLKNNKLHYTKYGKTNSYDLPRSLFGPHNKENVEAAIAACEGLGISQIRIINSLGSFIGLKHRMQYVGVRRNVHYYNDSKATNSSAAANALKALDKIYWLAGGVYKEKSFSAIESAMKNVKKAYLYGESKKLFAEVLKEKKDFALCSDLEDAVKKARIDAEKVNGSSILLSPACASFDQYKSFEERGDEFIKLYEKK